MRLEAPDRAAAVAAPAVTGPLERSETAVALRGMSSRTRETVPPALLHARVGHGTLAGALNDQVRFRVERRGSRVADWQLVPDSPLAHALAGTTAGGRLGRQLRAAMESTGHLGARSNLKGFILPDDLEGVIAARALAFLDDPAEPEGARLRSMGAMGDVREAGRLLRSWRPAMASRAQRAGAWNGEGWVTFLPHTARAMLVAAGAYRPDGIREGYLRQAADRVRFLAGNGAHEVQHSVTDRTASATFTWMEEGIANVFSRTPIVHAGLARAAGLTPRAYAGMLAHAPSFDTGWAPYGRPANAPGAGNPARERERARMYDRSHRVMRELARLAGADFRSRTGRAHAFDLLQGQSLRYVPGRLADAIIDRHGLDPRVRERLRATIVAAIDLPHGARDIAREFGIASPAHATRAPLV